MTRNDARGRQVITIPCGNDNVGQLTVSCAGDNTYRQLLSQLSAQMRRPVNSIVAEALLQKYGEELAALQANDPVAEFKDQLINLSKKTGVPMGMLVREALDETYEEELEALLHVEEES